jgi:hypothetical protein
VAAGLGLLLVLAGTVHGSDADFPFGPFRMYSTRHDPNGNAGEIRVRVILVSGRIVDVTDAAGAPRRAEIEGRLSTLLAEPEQLVALAPLYTRHLPEPARMLELVRLTRVLHGGRTVRRTVQVLCSVPVPG